MKKNINNVQHKIISEPLYIILNLTEKQNAHEIIRKITLKQDNKNLKEILKDDYPQLYNKIIKYLKEKNISFEIFQNPKYYTGLAAKKTLELCQNYTNIIEQYEKKQTTS